MSFPPPASFFRGGVLLALFSLILFFMRFMALPTSAMPCTRSFSLLFLNDLALPPAIFSITRLLSSAGDTAMPLMPLTLLANRFSEICA